MDNQTNSLQQQPVKSKVSFWLLTIGTILYIVSMFSSFLGGFFLQSVFTVNNPPTSSITPTPTIPSKTSEIPENNTTFKKGGQYFDDTIMAVTTDPSHLVFIATAARQETGNGANQSTRVSFYDGNAWTRKTLTKHHDTAAIYTNDILIKWQIDIDPTRVLKQQVQGRFTIDSNTIDFDTGIISNDIAVRSLPGYTKFISTGNGTLTINGKNYASKIFYTRIYSNDASEIQFYNTPLNLTTHYLVFFDESGNIYHVDSTLLDKPTNIYQTHQFGALVDTDGRVSKTFSVSVQTSSENPPHTYTVSLAAPINRTIQFTTQSSLNKAPNNSYSWFMSRGEGQAENIHGYGLIEYIHN